MKAGYATHEAKFTSIMQTIKEAEINLLRGVNPTDRHILRYMPYTYLMSEDVDKWTQSQDGGRRYGAMTTNISECLMGYLKVPAVCPLLQWLSSHGPNLLHISTIDMKKFFLISLKVRCGVIMQWRSITKMSRKLQDTL